MASWQWRARAETVIKRARGRGKGVSVEVSDKVVRGSSTSLYAGSEPEALHIRSYTALSPLSLSLDRHLIIRSLFSRRPLCRALAACCVRRSPPLDGICRALFRQMPWRRRCTCCHSRDAFFLSSVTTAGLRILQDDATILTLAARPDEGARTAGCKEAHQAHPVWGALPAGDCGHERAGGDDAGHV